MSFSHLKDYSLSKPKKERVEVYSAPPIDTPIEAQDLKTLNLDSELLVQYKNAKSLYNMSSNDPVNQRTAVLNTITSILTQIVKLQTDLYDAEYTKKIEATLIKTLKQFPDLQAAFFENYEAALDV